jgi:hypothetical protein
MTSPAATDQIEHRYLNMDSGCYTTQYKLLEYAGAFRGGIHRAVHPSLTYGPVLIAYGTRHYTHDDMKALDARLSLRRSGDA